MAEKEEKVESNSADSIGDAFEIQTGSKSSKKPSAKKSAVKAAAKPAKKAAKEPAAAGVKALSQHIGLIQGEVAEITKRYEALKEQKEAPAEEESLQVKSDDQQKIEKFAKMLATMNKFKKQYKSAKDTGAKKNIHKKIADFTQKWLDAKNLQLSDQIEVKK